MAQSGFSALSEEVERRDRSGKWRSQKREQTSACRAREERLSAFRRPLLIVSTPTPTGHPGRAAFADPSAGRMSSTRFREHPMMGSDGGLVCNESQQKPFFAFQLARVFRITIHGDTLVAAIAAFETTATRFGAVITRIRSATGTPFCLAN